MDVHVFSISINAFLCHRYALLVSELLWCMSGTKNTSITVPWQVTLAAATPQFLPSYDAFCLFSKSIKLEYIFWDIRFPFFRIWFFKPEKMAFSASYITTIPTNHPYSVLPFFTKKHREPRCPDKGLRLRYVTSNSILTLFMHPLCIVNQTNAKACYRVCGCGRKLHIYSSYLCF